MLRAHVRRIAKKIQRPYDVYNRIEVSKSAILHNVNFFRRKTGMQVIPVLKGNAYGHGIEQVSTALKSVKIPYIAVDGYFEAMKVRQFTNTPVLIMSMIKPSNFPKLRLRNFTFVVQDEATIHALGKLNKNINVHLEVNTGMNRYGVPAQRVSKIAILLQNYPKLHLEGVMSHLADADGTEEATVHEAVKRFDDAAQEILAAGFKPKLFHIGQSAGSLRAESRYANAVRIGIALYGVNPMPKSHKLAEKYKDLRPAMRLVSTISRVNELKKEDKVSYNYTFTAPKDMRVGVLPLGYHEGVNRALSNVGVVKLGRKSLPIIGRICMNHTIISLDGTNASAGDEIVIYSNNPEDENSINQIAAKHGFFVYSLLTDLSPDVRRYLVE